MKKDDRLRKISGLLKQAESVKSEEEKITFFTAAKRLMDKWEISQMEIDKFNAEYVEERYDTGAKTAKDHLEQLALNVGDFCDVQVFRQRLSNRQIFIVFFGQKTDVQMALSMFKTLNSFMESELVAYRKTEAYKQAYGSGQAKSRSFRIGFYMRIGERLAQIKAKTQDLKLIEAQQKGLVLYDKAKKVREELEKAHSNMKQARQSQTNKFSASAYKKGQDSGNKAKF